MADGLSAASKTANATTYWQAENAGPVSDSETAYGSVSMTPKTLISRVKFPRQLLVQAAVAKGFQPVSLGNRVLRAETAGLAALAALSLD